MATITTGMVRELWRRLYRKDQGKEDMKTGPLPSTAQIKAVFQAIEDRWDADFVNYKGQMIAANQGPMTDSQANAYLKGWLASKAERGNV